MRTQPEFLKLWIGQTISQFGSNITREGVPLLAVLTLAAQPEQLGLLSALPALPVLLFGVVVGVGADRLPRRALMIAADLLRAVLLLALPAAFLTGHLTMALLYIVLPLHALLTLVYSVAYRAVLPGIVGEDDLLEANRRLATSEALAEVGGPPLAGVLVQTLSAPLAVVFDAISYVFSAVSLSMVRVAKAGVRPPLPARRTSLLYEARAGFDALWAHPVTRTLMLGATARAFFGNFYAALYGYYVITQLALPPLALGVLVGAGGVGGIAGALLGGRLQRWTPGAVLVSMLAVGGVTGFLTPLAGWVHAPPALAFALLLLSQLVGDGLMTVYGIYETSAYQSLVPDALLGRANAALGVLTEGIAPLGALVGGVLGALLGAHVALTLTALVGAATALYTARSAVWRYS